MIAITRSARIAPSSISRVSSEASETEWIGTLRTSMAGGSVDMTRSLQVPAPSDQRGSVGDHDRPGRTDVGHGVDDPVQAGDHAGQVGALHEPAHRIHLRAHRPTGEV